MDRKQRVVGGEHVCVCATTGAQRESYGGKCESRRALGRSIGRLPGTRRNTVGMTITVASAQHRNLMHPCQSQAGRHMSLEVSVRSMIAHFLVSKQITGLSESPSPA